MKQCFFRLLITALMIGLASFSGFAQGGTTSASLSGVVMDTSGGVIPGAEVTVKNDATGTEFKAITTDNGTFSIPSLSPGTYTATITMPSFKVQVVKDITISPMTPANIRITLQVGGTNETVTVQANTEVLQSQSATISTTLMTNQIISLPLVTRSAMDFITLLPGVNTTGTNRASTIGALSGGAINITIDGVNTQDNYNRSSDGFFSYIAPRLDAVQEVTMSTATPGAESAGQGAVQIKFVTRSGNNDYHGSLYEYHKNPVLNSNYWFNNRNYTPPPGVDWTTWKAPRNRVLLNQYGGRFGGPITLPKWLGGPLAFSGKDRAFFFVNYEESRQPNQQTVTDTLFNPKAEDSGIFRYQVGNEIREVNLYQLAASKGQTATEDPTIQKQLATMRASTQYGTVADQPNPNYQYFYFINSAVSIRKFLTTRGDFNLTSKHRLEMSWNYAQYVPSMDFLNGAGFPFPGAPNYGTQGSNRFSTAIALRSTLTPRLVNEFRLGLSGGTTLWSPELTDNSQFKDMNYYYYAYPANTSNYYNTINTQRRSSPITSIDDTMTWTKGSHSWSFGTNWTNVGSWYYNKNCCPGLGMGLSSAYDPAYVLFNSANSATNFPGANSSQISDAINTYATLTGRVTSVLGTAWLNEITKQYTYQGPQVQRSHQRELALYASDSWRAKPGLTINYGVRWDLQFPFTALNDVWSYATVDQVWGPSGVNSLFTPGATGGVVSQVNPYSAGTAAYNKDWKTFAPSVGFAWSPSFKNGVLEHILGTAGQSVIRAGYSIAYNRYGIGTYAGVFSSMPGASLNATRNTGIGNFPADGGAGAWPVLMRDLFSGAINLPPANFASTPSYPITLGVADTIRAFDPNIRTPYTQSWTFGWQRELTKDMVLEVRYVANRNLQTWNLRSINERTYTQNGFMDEFKLAMANLRANQAYNGKNTFAYTGAPGTAPLPITLAYFSGYNKAQASDTTKYNSSLFTNSTFVNALAFTNPNPSTYASNLYSDAGRRANAIAAGLSANFFIPNPYVGTAQIYENGGYNYYDSMVVELRRRMAKGLMVSANYVFAKSEGSSIISFTQPYAKVVGATLPHTFKINWMYELPIGKGKTLFADAGSTMDKFIGGWEVEGIGRVQAGNMLDLGSVRLVGMTVDDLRSTAGMVFKDAAKQIYYEPDDIRLQTIAAFSTTGTTTTGYTGAAPTGRYIAPASSPDCIQIYAGDCAAVQTFLRGPMFVRFDLSLVKKVRFSETKNFELRGEFLNAFNNVNFYGTYCTGNTTGCGQVTSAWQDPNGTGEQGGRTVQIQARINF